MCYKHDGTISYFFSFPPYFGNVGPAIQRLVVQCVCAEGERIVWYNYDGASTIMSLPTVHSKASRPDSFPITPS